MLYSIVKEGTTRWLKGLVGCFSFTEASRQGAWWWPPGRVVLQTQLPLATEELFGQQKAGPSFALVWGSHPAVRSLWHHALTPLLTQNQLPPIVPHDSGSKKADFPS